MDITIRLERKPDYRAVEELTREAFWNYYSPGCDEHYLVHIMRESSAFIKELDFVAICGQTLVANIMYTRALILGDDGIRHPVVSFGPVSVLPEFQGRGIGSGIIEHSKEAAKNMGYTAILIYGDPEYYKRAGFLVAETYFIGTPENAYAASLLACELTPGALSGCRGRFFTDGIYELDQCKAQEFDRTFSYKEKITGLLTQVRFKELVSMKRPRV